MRLSHPLLSSPIHWREKRILLLEQRMPEPLPGEAFCLLDESLCELRLDSQEEIR